jgi:hypothetical protein
LAPDGMIGSLSWASSTKGFSQIVGCLCFRVPDALSLPLSLSLFLLM